MDLSNLNQTEIMVIREALANYNHALGKQIENLTVSEIGLYDILKMYELRKKTCGVLQKLFFAHDGKI